MMLTAEKVMKMGYTDFVSLIHEENRPPGGKRTVREILSNSFVSKDSKVLEIGSTNGFTSLEVARVIGCKVKGIDINPRSVHNANSRVRNERAVFAVGNAYAIDFPDNYFDLVICSNATSFMKDKRKAISEYSRVARSWGFIAMTPMYYRRNPPKNIVASVSGILQVPLDVRTKKDWLDLCNESGLEIYYMGDYKFDKKTDSEIEEYVLESLNKPHLNRLPQEVREAIYSRWKEIMKVFAKNLEYVGYSIILLRKRMEREEVELFTVQHA